MAPPKINSQEISSILRPALLALVAITLLVGMSGLATAGGHDRLNDGQSCEDRYNDDSDIEDCNRGQLSDTFTDIGDFIVFVVVAIAVPNGAYGFLEWMTANDSVEKDDRGRRRIRNTFIALGGVGILRFAVEMMKLFIPGL